MKEERKGISFRIKITLWFTGALIFLCVTLFACVLLLYQYHAKIDVWDNLQSVVDEYAEELQTDQVLLELLLEEDSEEDVDYLFYYEKNVLLALYYEDGTPAQGIFASTKIENIPFEDGEMQEAKLEEIPCCIYTRKIQRENGNMWLRGVVYMDIGWTYIFSVIKDMLPVVPAILLLALLGGYYLAGRFLKPITGITEAARAIRSSKDLTRRIPVKENGDELSLLACAFNSMLEELEKNFEVQQQFTSNASHELRTPVAIIQAQCEYALEHPEDSGQLLESLQVIHRQGGRMEKLIETLLLLTRMEQHTAHYPMSSVNFSDVTEKICEDWRRMQMKNIRVQEDVEKNVKISGNEELLYLLLNNLLQNACRYGKPDGNVWVTLVTEEKNAVLKVRDDGIGIAPEDLSRIWERFYQQDPSRSQKGMGLGLSLVKMIVEYHKGTITVSSTEGEGTEFCVTIPKNE